MGAPDRRMSWLDRYQVNVCCIGETQLKLSPGSRYQDFRYLGPTEREDPVAGHHKIETIHEGHLNSRIEHTAISMWIRGVRRRVVAV